MSDPSWIFNTTAGNLESCVTSRRYRPPRRWRWKCKENQAIRESTLQSDTRDPDRVSRSREDCTGYRQSTCRYKTPEALLQRQVARVITVSHVCKLRPSRQPRPTSRNNGSLLPTRFEINPPTANTLLPLMVFGLTKNIFTLLRFWMDKLYEKCRLPVNTRFRW